MPVMGQFVNNLRDQRLTRECVSERIAELGAGLNLEEIVTIVRQFVWLMS